MFKKQQLQFIQNLNNPSLSISGISSANFAASEVMNIYRNNYYYTLTGALSATYSCIKRLVGDDFFEFLAKNYIDKNPATSGNIIDYGDNFANFISVFEPCKDLVYLSDIALFENYYELCFHNLQTYYLSSKYAIIEIWQLSENDINIDINQVTHLQIYYQNNQVVVKKITQEFYQQKH